MQIKTQHKNYILAVCWYSKNWGKKQQKFWRNNVHLLCKKLLFMCCTGKESEKQILVKRWIFAEKFLPWKPILRYVVGLTSYLNENELYRVLFVLEFYTYTTVKLYELLIVAAGVAGIFKITSVSYFWSKSIQVRSVQ